MLVSMCVGTEEILRAMLMKSGCQIVQELSEKYKFDYEEGVKHLKLEERKIKKEGVVKEQSKMVLPFCGVKCIGNCEAIRLNHGLYTQCTKDGTEVINGNSVCKTCLNQIEKNSNEKPTYGYIDERVNDGARFRDPKGKAPVRYANIMEKLNISRADAEKEAAKQGLTIPEDEFEIKKVQRGRPKKDTTAPDTSGSEDEPIKKPRGRPKKVKQVVSASAGEELIKDLVNKSQPIKTIELPSPPPPQNVEITSSSSDDPESSDDEEEELSVTEFKINGVKYLKSADDTIYDFKTHDELGTWNPKSKKLELCH